MRMGIPVVHLCSKMEEANFLNVLSEFDEEELSQVRQIHPLKNLTMQ